MTSVAEPHAQPDVTRTGRIEREIRVEARPETVFAFFTDPEKYVRWKGRHAQLDVQIRIRRKISGKVRDPPDDLPHHVASIHIILSKHVHVDWHRGLRLRPRIPESHVRIQNARRLPEPQRS